MLFRSWPSEIVCCFFVKISGNTIMKTNSHSWIGRIFELLPISIASCCWGTQVEGSHKGKLPLLGDSWKSEDVKVSICKGEIWISNFPMIIEKSGAPKVKKTCFQQLCSALWFLYSYIWVLGSCFLCLEGAKGERNVPVLCVQGRLTCLW